MKKSYSDYLSSNDIYYHHTLNTNPLSDKPNGYRSESHRRIEILYLISGDVDYRINGATFHIHPGDVIVVNAQELHSLKIYPEKPYERIVLQFASNLIPTINDLDLTFPFLNAYRYQHIIPKEIVAKSKIASILKSILPLTIEPNKYKDVKIISKVIDVICEINQMVDILMTSEYHLIPQPKTSNELLQSVIKHINENVNSNYSITQLASAFNVSESYLYRFFKQNMGLTIHQYISNQKLQYASSLLNQGYTPQYVSDFLGYDYYTTFYMQFKRKFKKAPKAVVKKLPSLDTPKRQKNTIANKKTI